MTLVGSNPAPEISGLEELPGKNSYFIGNDPAKWRTNIPTYSKVKYHNIYPGVDLVYYGNHRQVECDFVIASGADPSAIRLRFKGAGTTYIDAQGNLVLQVKHQSIRLLRPNVYQTSRGLKRTISGRYVLKGESWVGLQIGSYDTGLPLIIDPVLSYSTYLGGTALDQVSAIAVDAAGNTYVTGSTASADFPTAITAPATKPFQPVCASCPTFPDAFVAKLNPSGSALVYSTFLGGGDLDEGRGIAVDSSGNAYVTGITDSTGFPTTSGAFRSLYQGSGDAFVAKIDPTGSSLLYSTYLGGNGADEGLGVAVDSSSKVYVTGDTNSDNFPTTTGAFQTVRPSTGAFTDAFVAKLDPTASGAASLLYSTFLGGIANNDQGNGIAVDSAGNAYIAGQTLSQDFPTTKGAFDQTCGSDGLCDAGQHADGFVTKLNPSGTNLVYSTFLGGAALDEALAIALDSSGNAYVTGLTKSIDFPTTPGVLQAASAGGYHSFVTKLNASGSGLVYSTYLGGSGFDEGNAIAADSSGNAYVAGETGSVDFPLASPLPQRPACVGCPGFVDAFVAKLNSTGSALIFSAFLGGSSDDRAFGIAVDSSGNAYVAGFTSSSNFLTANPLQPTAKGAGDGFVAKMAGLSLPVVTLSATALKFSSQIVGSTSAATGVRLSNNGDVALSITAITASGDFSETDNCGQSVNVGASCAINITFTPTTGGDRSGTLKVNDNAGGSPHEVSLSGTGEDFTLTAGTGSSTSATVTAGRTATYGLSIAALGGFNQAISLTCSGAPPAAICSVSPASLSPNGSSSSTATVTVTTTAHSTAERGPKIGPESVGGLPLLHRYGIAMLWSLALLLFAVLVLDRKAPSAATRSTLAATLILVLLWVACGGGNPGTPPGTYSLTVTGASASGSTTLKHDLTLTLTVN